jgi:23S rRNA G2445 N2-methylase RlmL
MKYKLNVARDVDTDEPGSYILNLPYGFRFYDDLVHVRGYDTMRELREAVRDDVIPCDCPECEANPHPR